MPAHGRSTRPPSTDEYGAGGTTSGASGPSRASVAGRSSSAVPGPLRPNSESSRHRLCVRRRPAPACLASLHRTQPASSTVRRLGHETRLPAESFPRRSAAIPPGAGTTSSSDARTASAAGKRAGNPNMFLPGAWREPTTGHTKTTAKTTRGTIRTETTTAETAIHLPRSTRWPRFCWSRNVRRAASP